MHSAPKLAGVYAAVVTPLLSDLSPDLEGLATLIQFLAGRGCHGVLLMGTTGEGPSFSREERLSIFKAAVEARKDLPDFRLMAGTGTPSLEDSIYLTRAAFELGFDAAVILPPYYYRKAGEAGLFQWFSHVIDQAVPSSGVVLAYHIPPVTGVDLSMDFLAHLKDTYPDQFYGIKDSSGDPGWAEAMGKRFGRDLLVLNGNDRLFSIAMQCGAAGCITALANLLSPLHRQIWDSFQNGSQDEITQDKLSSAREVFDRYPPFPPLIKTLLARLHGFPAWPVKPPLQEFDLSKVDIVLSEYLASVE